MNRPNPLAAGETSSVFKCYYVFATSWNATVGSKSLARRSVLQRTSPGLLTPIILSVRFRVPKSRCHLGTDDDRYCDDRVFFAGPSDLTVHVRVHVGVDRAVARAGTSAAYAYTMVIWPFLSGPTWSSRVFPDILAEPGVEWGTCKTDLVDASFSRAPHVWRIFELTSARAPSSAGPHDIERVTLPGDPSQKGLWSIVLTRVVFDTGRSIANGRKLSDQWHRWHSWSCPCSHVVVVREACVLTSQGLVVTATLSIDLVVSARRHCWHLHITVIELYVSHRYHY